MSQVETTTTQTSNTSLKDRLFDLVMRGDPGIASFINSLSDPDKHELGVELAMWAADQRRLLNQSSQPQSSGGQSSTGSTGQTQSTKSTTPPDPNAANYVYANVPGFNLDKIKDPTHVNAKYTPDVRLFSRALAATGAQPNAEGIQQVADWINANGGNVKVSRDCLSFNGGPWIDCITNFGSGVNSNWWFNNNP
jgi:hypothetical protein